MPESIVQKFDKTAVWLRDRIGIRTLEFTMVLCLICGISVALIVRVGSGVIHSLEAFAASMP
jgi:hypothetical protein